MNTKEFKILIADERSVPGELVEKYGKLEKQFNVYYTTPKCVSVDYSIRFYSIFGKSYVWYTNECDAWPATSEDEDLPETCGYWE